jgi:uncharacterized protein YvpB
MMKTALFVVLVCVLAFVQASNSLAFLRALADRVAARGPSFRAPARSPSFRAPSARGPSFKAPRAPAPRAPAPRAPAPKAPRAPAPRAPVPKTPKVPLAPAPRAPAPKAPRAPAPRAPAPAPRAPVPASSKVYFSQIDPQWNKNVMGSKTINAKGCVITSLAMAMASKGMKIDGQTANPASVNQFLKSNSGYSGDSIVWGTMNKAGLKYNGMTTSQGSIQNSVANGQTAILNVRGGAHWVLATGYANGVYTINDPDGGSKRQYTVNASEVKRAALYN